MNSKALQSTEETLAPWALRPTVRTTVLRPGSVAEISRLLRPVSGGLLPVGALRAYGDACVNPGGAHISSCRLNRILHFDTATGALVCESGVTLKQIIGQALPCGWFLPVVPGTMLSSVGGAVACDVHGKSHHHQGSFASAVTSLELLTADGELRLCSRSQHPELFWATTGGLGQTGIIVSVSLQLQRVETAYVHSRNIKTRDLDQTLDLCLSVDEHFSVCWIDSLARGRKLGRGVLMVGHHATREELAAFHPKASPLATRSPLPLSLPVSVPSVLTGTPTWRAFNAAYYALAGRDSHPHVVPFQPYFFPLDTVAHWNRVYGRNGFIEYQFAVPLSHAESVCRGVLERLAGSGNGSFLAVLKRFGPASPGHLSFPIDGVTLAVDMPARGTEQASLLNQLDEVVARAGGRIYLVKDSRLSPAVLDTMYPRRKEWAGLVNRHDPAGVFTSSLVRRLNLRS